MRPPNDKPIFAEERKRAIVEQVKNGALSVAELVEIFNVSPTTIRNDLRELESQGLLVRTHGGAMPRHQTGAETTLDQRVVENVQAKQAIAQLALACIEDGDTLILDVGTTTYELARLVGLHRRVRIVTNDLKIALLADEFDNLDIFMVGGKLRPGYHSVVGAAAVRHLRDFAVDRAFLGTNAFDMAFGASAPDSAQAEVKRAMLDAATKNYILCDASKFGKRSFVCFAPFKTIDVLITDAISNADLRLLEEGGLEVLSASVY